MPEVTLGNHVAADRFRLASRSNGLGENCRQSSVSSALDAQVTSMCDIELSENWSETSVTLMSCPLRDRLCLKFQKKR